MAHRRGRDTGPAFYGPLRSRFRPEGQAREFTDSVYGWNPRLSVDYWWDFSGAAAGYLADRGGLLVSRGTGSPTGITQVANSANGELSMALANTNELEFIGVDFTDELVIPITRGVVFEAYIKTPALALASVEDFIAGLGVAYNSTLATVAKYVRFRLNGSNVLLIEANDGTTANTLTAPSTATTLAVSTYYLFTIDGHRPGYFDFYVNDDLIGTLQQAAFAVTDLMQPSVGVRKASGATTTAFLMDFMRIEHLRI